MKICVIGTGYVGLTAGTCLSELGNSVICIDNNKEKIEQLKNGIIPIYEPELENLIKRNVQNKRLSFSMDIENAVKTSQICYIAVATPQTEYGSCDLSSIFGVIEEIARNLNEYKLIINKSTVPVGVTEKLKNTVKSITDVPFDIISNPEFLRQGAAVKDFLCPDRIIVGCESTKAVEMFKNIYSSNPDILEKIICMDIKSAEMTKYAANVFLANRISFINEIANICEKVGADIDFVRAGISSDRRIGNKFLYSGIGFGGSCFPKDLNALICIAKENKVSCSMLEAVKTVNVQQRNLFVKKITDFYGENIAGKTFAVWGLSFKPLTNDMREAPSIPIINALLEKGAKIQAYDPKAFENAKKIFKDTIIYSTSAYKALENSDALILLTEWEEFKKPDFEKLKSMLKDKIIFDGRNQFKHNILKDYDLKYVNIGGSGIL